MFNMLLKQKNIYLSMVRNDFRSRYNGSAFGNLWGVIQPLVTIAVYWFVFAVGMKASARPDGTPFILWLICGMIPWFFISEALGAQTNSLIEYAYLVKKVQFRVELIPLIKLGSSLILHIVFVFLMMIVLNINGYWINWYYLQFFYYLFATCFLLVGLGLLFSAITVYFRDMSQIVGILVQIGFWVIPIVWGVEMLPERLRVVFMLNPFYYLVEGYRGTFLAGEPFWSHPYQTAYFWGLSIVLFLIGRAAFNKLKPTFADVL